MVYLGDMVFLRNTSAKIPESLQDKFPEYGSVKCFLSRKMEDGFKTSILFYAIPKSGSGPRVKINSREFPNIGPEEDGKLVSIAKNFLADKRYISRILEENLNKL